MLHLIVRIRRSLSIHVTKPLSPRLQVCTAFTAAVEEEVFPMQSHSLNSNLHNKKQNNTKTRCAQIIILFESRDLRQF